jgi:hypothetical protein
MTITFQFWGTGHIDPVIRLYQSSDIAIPRRGENVFIDINLQGIVADIHHYPEIKEVVVNIYPKGTVE